MLRTPEELLSILSEIGINYASYRRPGQAWEAKANRLRPIAFARLGTGRIEGGR